MFPSRSPYLNFSLRMVLLLFSISILKFAGIKSGALQFKTGTEFSFFELIPMLRMPYIFQDQVLVRRKNLTFASPWHTEGDRPFFNLQVYESELWSDDVLVIPEQMPRFPGCEEIIDEQERKTCSDKKLLEFVYSNFKLPPELKSSCQFYPGVSVVQFIVEKDGTISDLNMVRDPGLGLGDSVLAAVQKIQRQNIRWIPGQQNGQPVRVQFNLPVRFHLE